MEMWIYDHAVLVDNQLETKILLYMTFHILYNIIFKWFLLYISLYDVIYNIVIKCAFTYLYIFNIFLLIHMCDTCLILVLFNAN